MYITASVLLCVEIGHTSADIQQEKEILLGDCRKTQPPFGPQASLE